MTLQENDFEEDINQLMFLIRETIEINSHLEFFLWLQGKVQKYLPHEVMIAAWGDFSLGIIYYDIVSAIPGIRTSLLSDKDMVPFLKRLHTYWSRHDRTPFHLMAEKSVIRCRDIDDLRLKTDLQSMKSALIHAIKDVRSGNDCLYVLLSTETDIPSSMRKVFQHLLPYIDAVLRQVEHLPGQLPDTPNELEALSPARQGSDDFSLSDRECEIMNWVSQGKTNAEIGIILNISSFTVKNHLQRIFRKLDVFNRSQAVSKFQPANLTQ